MGASLRCYKSLNLYVVFAGDPLAASVNVNGEFHCGVGAFARLEMIQRWRIHFLVLGSARFCETILPNGIRSVRSGPRHLTRFDPLLAETYAWLLRAMAGWLAGRPAGRPELLVGCLTGLLLLLNSSLSAYTCS